jgi:protein TonB
MFELISGGPRHPFHDKTPAPVMLSVALHVVVLTVIVIVPLLYATDSLPKVPTMMAFVADAPTAPPPPPPPPPAQPAKAAETPKAVSQPSTNPNAAPIEAPAQIVPEPPGPVRSGGEGGVEGGIEGGVVGGIVGGLVAAPPPPPPPPPPPAAPPKVVRIGGAIQAPALIKRVEPVYPDLALMAKVGGVVILEAMVGDDGRVTSVKVLRSVKFLDQAAVDAVAQWQYSPLVLNGVPTPFVLTVTLSFRTAS